MAKIIEVAAGTYDVFDTVAETTTTVTVPVLTAGSIDQASPEIGDTLTVSGSNASSEATFQWQESADGSTGITDLIGETDATYDTSSFTATEYVRRGVSDGVQGPVYTSFVQVAAAPVLSTRIIKEDAGDSSGSIFNTTVDFVAEGVEVGDTILIACGGQIWASDCTVGGSAATKVTTNTGGSGARLSGFEYVVQSGDINSAVVISLTTDIASADIVVNVFASPLSVLDVGNTANGDGSTVSISLTGAIQTLVAVAIGNDVPVTGASFSANVTQVSNTAGGSSDAHSAIGNDPASNTVTFDSSSTRCGLILWGLA